MTALPYVALVFVIILIIVFSLWSRRGHSDVPNAPQRTSGRVRDSLWMSQEEFTRFVASQDLVQPKNPAIYKVWVRSGTAFVAAVSMQSGDRYLIHKIAIN